MPPIGDPHASLREDIRRHANQLRDPEFRKVFVEQTSRRLRVHPDFIVGFVDSLDGSFDDDGELPVSHRPTLEADAVNDDDPLADTSSADGALTEDKAAFGHRATLEVSSVDADD